MSRTGFSWIACCQLWALLYYTVSRFLTKRRKMNCQEFVESCFLLLLFKHIRNMQTNLWSRCGPIWLDSASQAFIKLKVCIQGLGPGLLLWMPIRKWNFSATAYTQAELQVEECQFLRKTSLYEYTHKVLDKNECMVGCRACNPDHRI